MRPVIVDSPRSAVRAAVEAVEAPEWAVADWLDRVDAEIVAAAESARIARG